jgi:hypothetical protein
MRHTSEGTLLVYTDKVIVVVDEGLASFYRAMVPKAWPVKPGRYAPHITVARAEPISDKWMQYSGTRLHFEYDNILQNNGSVYWWLNVYCPALNVLRVHCGLPMFSEKSRPPDGSDHFHITVGNTK